MSVNLKSLIGKLNDTTRNALEAAAGLCVSRTHYDIEIEHFLMKVLDAADNDIALILKQFGVDRSRLTAELTRSLDRLKTGNARTSGVQPCAAEDADRGLDRGDRSSIGADQIRTGFTILALAAERRAVADDARCQQGIAEDSIEAFRKDFFTITEQSARRRQRPPRAAAPGESGDAPRPAGSGKTPHLDQYTVNLTANAKSGKDRSGAGARSRDPAGGRHPDAPPPEQPDPDGRSRASARPPWSKASRCGWRMATCRPRCAT